MGVEAVIEPSRREIPRDPGRHGAAAGAAADHRPRHRRRLHLCAGGSARRRSEGAGAGRARAPRRGQPGPAAARACSAPSRPPIRRSISISTATRRKSSACTLSNVFQALAGLARRLFRQQRQSVRPHLAGPGAGRGGGPRRASTTSTASTCAAMSGKMIPLRSLVEPKRRRRPAGADPLQQSARRDDPGRAPRRASRPARR